MSQTIKNRAVEALSTAKLPASECYKLLASEHRRLTIDILIETTPPVELEDLATEIATRTVDVPSNDGAVERIAISLHHTHLPKMANAGLLKYDPELHLIKSAEPLQFQE
jgi:hypothetical protein